MADKARVVPVGCPLTGLQFRILELIAEGLTYKQIARKCGLSVSTIRSHVFNMNQRLGTAGKGSAQAVIACFKAGWLGSAPHDSGTYQVRRLADATERLIQRLYESPRGLKPYQRRYLNAFDVMLKARTDEQRMTAREAMDEALGPMLAEAGVDATKRRQRDLTELLLANIANAKNP